MQTLVFEIVVTLLLGSGADVDIPYLSRLFRAWTAGIATLPINLPFTTYHRALKAKTRLLAAIDAIVQARRRQPVQPKGVQPHDVLGALLSVREEEGRPLSQAAVFHELHNELFAGHDTTVTVMTNLMLQLAQHPAVLAQARQELQGAALAIPFDLEQIKLLPYLEAVLHESMRYLAPVAGTFRSMLCDMEYKGYRIPRGWTVRLEIAGTHTDERIWSNPFDFDPARWLPPRREQDQRQHCFVPFGGGPRLCLGANFAWAEMRVMLALLLRAYTWQVLPNQDLSYVMVPFPRPKQGLRVRFSYAPAD
jgi:cytochrome P450